MPLGLPRKRYPNEIVAGVLADSRLKLVNTDARGNKLNWGSSYFDLVDKSKVAESPTDTYSANEVESTPVQAARTLLVAAASSSIAAADASTVRIDNPSYVKANAGTSFPKTFDVNI